MVTRLQGVYNQQRPCDDGGGAKGGDGRDEREATALISVITTGNKEKLHLFTDGLSAIELANNPEHHAKTKHIDIQYHFVREHVTNNTTQLSHINTKEQLADILTKALPIDK